jgi:phage gpG-like protein
LSEAYRVRKAKLYPGKGILEASGDMKRALTVPGSYGNVDILEHNSLVLGTNLDYAVYHQHGTSRMPKRKPIELPESERREWTSILHKHIFANR